MPDLSTPTSRRKLPRSKVPTWVRVARGRSLGYRRPAREAGTWYARVFVGGDGSPYYRPALGTADDFATADGREILTYGQAVDRVLSLDPNDDEPQDRGQPFTVRRAVEHYLDWYKAHRRAHDTIRYSFEAHVLPELADIPLAALTAKKLRKWHQGIAESPARLRGGKLREAKTEDEKRARKVTANRLLKDLKAALNRAVKDGLVESTSPWQRVQPFRGVEVARAEYLEREELRRLFGACPPDFRDLVQAAVYTGARYGELAALRVEDFRPEASAVHFPKTKGGAPRYVYLGDEGLAFFERLSAGRDPKGRLLVKKDGSLWGRSHQYRLMQEACETAGIEPVGFHQLRHSYASLYLMGGGSLLSLAKQLGHTTTRMVERHYGHLADSWRAEEARKHAPSLGVEHGTVVRLGRVRRRA